MVYGHIVSYRLHVGDIPRAWRSITAAVSVTA